MKREMCAHFLIWSNHLKDESCCQMWPLTSVQETKMHKHIPGNLFSLVAILSDSIKRCKIFLFFWCHTCSGHDSHRCKRGATAKQLAPGCVTPASCPGSSWGTVSYISFLFKDETRQRIWGPCGFWRSEFCQTCCWNPLSSSGKADSIPPGETYSVSCSFVFLTRAHHANSRKRNRECLLFAPSVQSAAVISLADLQDI